MEPPRIPDMRDVFANLPPTKPMFPPTYQRMPLRELLAKGKVRIRCKCGESWSLGAVESLNSSPAFKHSNDCAKNGAAERIMLGNVSAALKSLAEALKTDVKEEDMAFSVEVEVEAPR